MKHLLVIVLIFNFLSNSTAQAPDFTGTWKGVYENDIDEPLFYYKDKYKLDIQQVGKKLMVLYTAYGIDSMNYRCYFQESTVQANGKSFALLSIPSNAKVEGLTPRMPNFRCSFKIVKGEELLYCEMYNDRDIGRNFYMKRIATVPKLPYEYQEHFAFKAPQFIPKPMFTIAATETQLLDTIHTTSTVLDLMLIDAGIEDGDQLRFFQDGTLMEDSVIIKKTPLLTRTKTIVKGEHVFEMELLAEGNTSAADIFLVMKDGKRQKNYLFTLFKNQKAVLKVINTGNR